MAAALLPSLALVLSCAQEPAVAERIRVTTPDGTAISKTVFLPLEGESSSWKVEAQEDLSIFYTQAKETEADWFSITGITRTAKGEYEVQYTVKPLENTLEVRSGSVSMVAPDYYLGAFLCVRQGYEKVWDKTFAGEGLSLESGAVWTSETLDGVSAVKDAWLSFTAEADAFVSGGAFSPLTVTLLGGGRFDDIARDTYQVDIPAGEEETFFKLHIKNGGRVFSSETRIRFSVPSGKSSLIRIGDVAVHEIPVARDGIIGISESDE